jgi:TonB family protein
MRKVFLAFLALSPIVAHAQANSPAQPQASAPPVVLSSAVHAPAFDAAEADTANVPSNAVRVSTGVNAPKLVHTVAVQLDSDFAMDDRFGRTAVVAMTVDATGKPSDLKVVKATDPEINKAILEAVSQYRFTPGTLDNQATSVPVNLEVVLRTPGW